MILRIEVLMDIEVTDELDERLAMGDEEAFNDLQSSLLDGTRALKRCEVLAAGPHNTSRFTEEG